MIFTGYFDIKQSLSIKRRQDRSEALQLPDETDPSTLLGLGQREFKSGNTEIAILFISKACKLAWNWLRLAKHILPMKIHKITSIIFLIPINFIKYFPNTGT